MSDHADHHQIREILRGFGEAANVAGEWTLDQFVLRHAPSSAEVLTNTARQIDSLEAQKRRALSRRDGWTLLAIASGFLAGSISYGVSGFYLSPWFWAACLGLAAGLIGRRLLWRTYSKAFDESLRLNEQHFDPLGVFYSPGCGVLRSPRL